jgi:hypothetical protein
MEKRGRQQSHLPNRIQDKSSQAKTVSHRQITMDTNKNHGKYYENANIGRDGG